MKRNHTHISRYLSAFLMLLLIPALTLMSQTPVVFNYQALLRDTEGTPKVNTSVSLEIEIHQGTITGTVVYSETHNTNTDAFGVVNLALGSVNPGSFETIDWSAGPYFVEVSVDGTSMGTSELLAVPYARHAAFAATVDMALVDAATAGWDKNEADDFDGAFGSLSGIPAGLADGDDDTQLNEGQVEAYIDGDETAFNGWDKNASDDFDGAFSSLSGIPSGLSDGDDNTQLSEGQVEAYIDGNESSFDGWDKNAADDITGQTRIQHYFQFVTFETGSASPIAFGFITPDGSISSGSGNFTCSWDGTNERYLISITGESYFWTDYTTVVTLAQASGEGGIVITDSVGGDLIVTIQR
jgi:hypothetical protein